MGKSSLNGLMTHMSYWVATIDMYLHGFEKRIFTDHSKWSSPGERDELLKVSTIGQLHPLTISSQSKGLL